MMATRPVVFAESAANALSSVWQFRHQEAKKLTMVGVPLVLDSETDGPPPRRGSEKTGASLPAARDAGGEVGKVAARWLCGLVTT